MEMKQLTLEIKQQAIVVKQQEHGNKAIHHAT